VEGNGPLGVWLPFPRSEEAFVRRICVYCGSRSGRGAGYTEAAAALSDALCNRQLGLVYGGASVGMMGTVADGVLARGGEAIGVIPESLVSKEVAHQGLSELIVTPDMHERKKVMADRADGFIAMPGGLGTLEELFEILTWAQLRFHAKPCGLLNVNGYYDPLVAFLDNAVTEGFIRPDHRGLLKVADDPATLLETLGFPAPEPR
jgi:hypothetical protein